jgi:hypothetical protein
MPHVTGTRSVESPRQAGVRADASAAVAREATATTGHVASASTALPSCVVARIDAGANVKPRRRGRQPSSRQVRR